MSTSSHPSDATLPVVRLLLDAGSTRIIASQPSSIAFGSLQLQSWQVFPVAADLREFPDQDGYLLKINYDLLLEPKVPAPSWFELGFTLSTPANEKVTIIDALPRHVRAPREETTYAIDERLDFVAGSGVKMPALAPKVAVFGVGGTGVRWWFGDDAHNGVEPGSYTGWVTFVTPRGCARITVDVHARFDCAEAFDYTPTDDPVRFTLDLTDTPRYTGPIVASTPDDTAPAIVRPPRVFVSYTHDDSRHATAVLRLAEFLMTECGLDVRMDRWDLDKRRDWYEWAMTEITDADFVLIIASPQCRIAGEGRSGAHHNRGMRAEMSIIRDLLQKEYTTWLPKLLPVVLPGRSVDEIPVFLQPYAADHYIIGGLTADGTEDLVRALTGQPRYIRPQIRGSIPDLPPVTR